MLGGELAERLENVLLNGCGLLFRVSRVIGHHRRREIRAVDGVVDGHRNLELGAVVDYGPCNTGPHGLDAMDEGAIGGLREMNAHLQTRVPGDIGTLGGDDAGKSASCSHGGFGLEGMRGSHGCGG